MGLDRLTSFITMQVWAITKIVFLDQHSCLRLDNSLHKGDCLVHIQNLADLCKHHSCKINSMRLPLGKLVEVPVDELELLPVCERLVQVPHRVGKLAAQDHLARPLLDRLDQVKDDDRVAVAVREVLEVQAGRLIHRVVAHHCKGGRSGFRNPSLGAEC